MLSLLLLFGLLHLYVLLSQLDYNFSEIRVHILYAFLHVHSIQEYCNNCALKSFNLEETFPSRECMV